MQGRAKRNFPNGTVSAMKEESMEWRDFIPFGFGEAERTVRAGVNPEYVSSKLCVYTH